MERNVMGNHIINITYPIHTNKANQHYATNKITLMLRRIPHDKIDPACPLLVTTLSDREKNMAVNAKDSHGQKELEIHRVAPTSSKPSNFIGDCPKTPMSTLTIALKRNDECQSPEIRDIVNTSRRRHMIRHLQKIQHNEARYRSQSVPATSRATPSSSSSYSSPNMVSKTAKENSICLRDHEIYHLW